MTMSLVAPNPWEALKNVTDILDVAAIRPSISENKFLIVEV